jgi:hypothetical protein
MLVKWVTTLKGWCNLKRVKVKPEQHSWVMVNGQSVYHGTFSQCRAYIALLNFGPDDLVQLQYVEQD